MSTYMRVEVTARPGEAALTLAELDEAIGLSDQVVDLFGYDSEQHEPAPDAPRVVHISGSSKWSYDELSSKATALSKRMPHLLVSVTEEWDDDEPGGSVRTYRGGATVAARELAWRDIPIEEAS